MLRHLVAFLLAALIVAAPASAAAPRYILVSGPRLAHPVMLDDWRENHALMLAFANTPRVRVSLMKRPRYELAMFWGWTDAQRPTSPTQANQRAWFYPAWHGARPIVNVVVNGFLAPRSASTGVLRILARHGVPTRL